VATDLEALYKEHRQALFTLALAITRNEYRAEDAVHEAFVRMFRRDGGTMNDPAAYVFSSVRNAAIDQVRRDGRRKDKQGSIFDVGESDGIEPRDDRGATGPAETVLDRERQRAVAEALERLSEPQREVIVMKVYGRLTFEQIGEALGERLSTVASRYRRGLGRLEDYLRKWQ
jgi:RNA polymerase sigma-70 factor (ECF subfamily)